MSLGSHGESSRGVIGAPVAAVVPLLLVLPGDHIQAVGQSASGQVARLGIPCSRQESLPHLLHIDASTYLFGLCSIVCVFVLFFALQAPKHGSFTVSQPVFKRSRHGRNVGGLGATRCGRVTFKMCPSEATKRNVGRALTSAACVCLCVCVSRVSKRPLLSHPWGRVVRRTTALGAVSSPLR